MGNKLVSFLAALVFGAPLFFDSTAMADGSLKVLTGSEQGTYHQLGHALRKALTDEIGIDPLSSFGSVGNVLVTAAGDADLCFAQGDVLRYMWTIPDQKEAAHKLKLVVPVHVEDIYILVTVASGINRLQDLDGKTVEVGPQDSGTFVTAKILLEAKGVSLNSVTLSNRKSDAGMARMESGKSEAMFLTGGTPIGSLSKLPATAKDKYKLLSLDEKTIETLAAPGTSYVGRTIPAGTYPFQAADVRTMGTRCLLLAHEKADEELIFRLTNRILSRADALKEAHPRWGELNEKLAKATYDEGLIPFHPGAARAIRDR